MKRIFSILLVLMLTLSLPTPAIAKLDPHSPIITKAPQSLLFIKSGNTLISEMEAELKEGCEGELSYAWYVYQNSNQEADLVITGPKLKLNIGEVGINKKAIIAATAINTYYDEYYGETLTCDISLNIYVYVYYCSIQKPFLYLRHYIMLIPSCIRNWWQKRNIV